jgi:hypothetical protein
LCITNSKLLLSTYKFNVVVNKLINILSLDYIYIAIKSSKFIEKHKVSFKVKQLSTMQHKKYSLDEMTNCRKEKEKERMKIRKGSKNKIRLVMCLTKVISKIIWIMFNKVRLG